MDLQLLIALSMGMMVFLVVLGISTYVTERKMAQERMKRVIGSWDPVGSEERQDTASPMRKRFFNLLEKLAGAAKPGEEEELSEARRSLIKAGYRSPDAPALFFGTKILLAIILPLVFTLLRASFLPTMAHLHTMFVFVLLAVIGFYTPGLWVRLKTARRQEDLFKGFPDALDLLVVCVEAGLGIDAALSRVGDEMRTSYPVLSEELRLLNLEMRAGQSRENALRNFGWRTEMEDIRGFVTLLIQTDRFGTSIAQALRVLSESMRTKRFQRAEELAAKLPTKMLFPLIFFILPSIFVVILGPGIIRIMRILLPVMTIQ